MSNNSDHKPLKISQTGVSLDVELRFDPRTLIQLLVILICGTWGGYLMWKSSLDIGNARPPWLSLILVLIAGIVLSLDVEAILSWSRQRTSNK